MSQGDWPIACKWDFTPPLRPDHDSSECPFPLSEVLSCVVATKGSVSGGLRNLFQAHCRVNGAVSSSMMKKLVAQADASFQLWCSRTPPAALASVHKSSVSAYKGLSLSSVKVEFDLVVTHVNRTAAGPFGFELCFLGPLFKNSPRKHDAFQAACFFGLDNAHNIAIQQQGNAAYSSQSNSSFKTSVQSARIHNSFWEGEFGSHPTELQEWKLTVDENARVVLAPGCALACTHVVFLDPIRRLLNITLLIVFTPSVHPTLLDRVTSLSSLPASSSYYSSSAMDKLGATLSDALMSDGCSPDFIKKLFWLNQYTSSPPKSLSSSLPLSSARLSPRPASARIEAIEEPPKERKRSSSPRQEPKDSPLLRSETDNSTRHDSSAPRVGKASAAVESYPLDAISSSSASSTQKKRSVESLRPPSVLASDSRSASLSSHSISPAHKRPKDEPLAASPFASSSFVRTHTNSSAFSSSLPPPAIRSSKIDLQQSDSSIFPQIAPSPSTLSMQFDSHRKALDEIQRLKESQKSQKIVSSRHMDMPLSDSATKVSNVHHHLSSENPCPPKIMNPSLSSSSSSSRHSNYVHAPVSVPAPARLSSSFSSSSSFAFNSSASVPERTRSASHSPLRQTTTPEVPRSSTPSSHSVQKKEDQQSKEQNYVLRIIEKENDYTFVRRVLQVAKQRKAFLRNPEIILSSSKPVFANPTPPVINARAAQKPVSSGPSSSVLENVNFGLNSWMKYPILTSSRLLDRKMITQQQFDEIPFQEIRASKEQTPRSSSSSSACRQPTPPASHAQSSPGHRGNYENPDSSSKYQHPVAPQSSRTCSPTPRPIHQNASSKAYVQQSLASSKGYMSPTASSSAREFPPRYPSSRVAHVSTPSSRGFSPLASAPASLRKDSSSSTRTNFSSTAAYSYYSKK